MKAYLADRYGGLEVMRLGELPEPVAGKGEAVVAVIATSVNPIDWKLRAGMLRFLPGARFPRAFGTEFSGVIHELGPGVQGWAVGDPVYGISVTALGRQGSHAERVAVPASALRRKPEALSHDDAATLTVAALTALNGLRLCGDLAGKSVLVNGATGGVGHFAVQIAKAKGARVTAVCSAANAPFARELGADAVLDYRVDDVTKRDDKFDVVFDAHGHLGFGAACQVLTPQGRYATPLGEPRVQLRSLVQNLFGRRKLLIGNVRSEPQDYAEIEGLVASGAVHPHIAREFPLDQAHEAFALQEKGGVPGKVVVRVTPGGRVSGLDT